jgi:hypothetical protein
MGCYGYGGCYGRCYGNCYGRVAYGGCQGSCACYGGYLSEGGPTTYYVISEEIVDDETSAERELSAKTGPLRELNDKQK